MTAFVWIRSCDRICGNKLHHGVLILCFTAFWVEIHHWSSFTYCTYAFRELWVFRSKPRTFQSMSLCGHPDVSAVWEKHSAWSAGFPKMVLAIGNASGSMDFLFLTFLPTRDVVPCFSLFQGVDGRTTWRNCPGTHKPGMPLCFAVVFTLKAWLGKLSRRHLRIFDTTVSAIASKFFIFYVYCWYIKAIFLNEFVCKDLADFTH